MATPAESIADEERFEPVMTRGDRLGHFEIRRLVGEGGMGQVYEAFDTKLQRAVAIKVLPEHMDADADLLARFKREAKILAALDHPNIASVYEFREEEATHYLVMQFIQGDTLAHQIRNGSNLLNDVVRVFTDVARGLRASHAKGVIHRDLKPANIKITPDGTAVVLDFGIARDTLVPAKDNKLNHDAIHFESNRSDDVAESNAIVGTPRYMSPEQASGETVDHRTDIWSFGCFLYETLTGETPFSGESTTKVLSSIPIDEPDWSPFRDCEYAELESIVRQCLKKDPNERPANFQEIVSRLRAIATEIPPSEAASTKPRRAMPFASLVWITVLVVGAATLVRIDSSRLTEPPAKSAAMHSFASIAVLPFENQSDRADTLALANELTDAITKELASTSRIAVTPSATAIRYRNTGKSPPQIAGELGVEGLVRGTIQKIDEQLHVNIALVDGRSNQNVWSRRVELPIEEISTAQGSIASKIAVEVGAALTASVEGHVKMHGTIDPEAWNLYLQARASWRMRSLVAFAQAIERLEEATQLDPDFAEAHALLALVFASRPLNDHTDPLDYPRARKSAERALELDPRALDAHLALVWASVPGEWDWDIANHHLNIALDIDPDHAYANMVDGAFKSWSGLEDEAAQAYRKAISLDPKNPLYLHQLSRSLLRQGKLELALAEAERAYASAPGWDIRATEVVVRALCGLGRFDEATAYFERTLRHSEVERMQWQAFVFEAAGRHEDAHTVINSFGDIFPGARWIPVDLLVRVGRTGQALRELEQWLVQRDDMFPRLVNNPDLQPLWEHDRFWELRARANMPALPPEHLAYAFQEQHKLNMQNEKLVSAETLVGEWRVRFADGSVLTLRLADDGSARKAPGDTVGTWKMKDAAAQITWQDGWRDILRPGSVPEIWAYAPGMDLSQPPTTKGEAKQLKPGSYPQL